MAPSASGEARVAIGARSAVFAPVGKDSLFIIDEEHESSYKADDCPLPRQTDCLPEDAPAPAA